MSSEEQGNMMEFEYCNPTAAGMSDLNSDLTHRHNRTSRLMKISLFANILFGFISVVLLSLFLCEIKDRSIGFGKTLTKSEYTDNFNSVFKMDWGFSSFRDN